MVTNFGEPLRAAQTPDVGDDEPLAEARMIAATCGGVRVVCVYAPNGRIVGSPFYQAKLAWFDRLARWLAEAADPAEPLVLGGDFNVAPEDVDVWDPQACHGGTHVSPPEREAFARLCRWGLIDAYRLHHPEPGRYTWWDYRAGNFHKNFGMRIDHLLATRPVAERTVWAEIDREARKGKPIPSDHAPLVIDLDQPGHPFDAGWKSAEGRIAARRARRGLMGREDGGPRASRSSRRSSRCSRSSRRSCPPATAGSSSRSGTASAPSCSATATGSTSRAAT